MTSPGTAHDAPPLRVLVADDHPLMLDAIRQEIAEDGGIEIVATAVDGEQLVDRYRCYEPDVALVDISMPGLDGLAAARLILEHDAGARIVILSARTDPSAVRAAFEAGAVGYLAKTVESGSLAAAVRQAAAGETVLDATSASALVGRLRAGDVGGGSKAVSAREAEILTLVGQGLTNAQIGESLYLSSETVKTHLDRIFDKLGVHDRVSAVCRAIELGVIDLPTSPSTAS
ncbi:MAG: response regulator transcription factor [Actinobacteria bacterium]|nr:response regulator transcription factor [Actinomycetota bacterium]